MRYQCHRDFLDMEVTSATRVERSLVLGSVTTYLSNSTVQSVLHKRFGAHYCAREATDDRNVMVWKPQYGPRSLRRHLAAEGTTYRKVLTVRYEVAKQSSQLKNSPSIKSPDSLSLQRLRQLPARLQALRLCRRAHPSGAPKVGVGPSVFSATL